MSSNLPLADGHMGARIRSMCLKAASQHPIRSCQPIPRTPLQVVGQRLRRKTRRPSWGVHPMSATSITCRVAEVRRPFRRIAGTRYPGDCRSAFQILLDEVLQRRSSRRYWQRMMAEVLGPCSGNAIRNHPKASDMQRLGTGPLHGTGPDTRQSTRMGHGKSCSRQRDAPGGPRAL